MTPVILICAFFAAVIAVIVFGARFSKKSELKKVQQYTDRDIERSLNDRFSEIRIETLATHSNQEKIARMVSSRFRDCIKLAIHPTKLCMLINNLGLNAAEDTKLSNKQLDLAKLIKKDILRYIDSYDLDVYLIAVSHELKPEFQKLNKTFLVKVEKNMMIW